jgi:transcriptional regulator with XRE-family HTH domain
MTGHRPFKELTAGFSRERRARVATRVGELKEEMALAELRRARQRSQVALARVLKVKQPAVAKLERRADIYVSNLRRYIEALGGTLEITARFPDKTVMITNFGELGQPATARQGKRRTRKSKTKPDSPARDHVG